MLNITKFRQLIIKQAVFTQEYIQVFFLSKQYKENYIDKEVITGRPKSIRIQRMSVKGVNTIGLLHQVLDPYIHENHKREEHESETPG
jgi:hypothetical protein